VPQRPLVQLRPAAHSPGAAQQISPSPPQVSQRPPTHTEPERHSSPGQHAPPSRPQSISGSVHTPPSQRRSLQHSALVRHDVPWSEQQVPPTQSAPPQQSSGCSHATPAPGTAQHSSVSQRRPAEQVPRSPQHACPTSPHAGVERTSGPNASSRENASFCSSGASRPRPASRRSRPPPPSGQPSQSDERRTTSSGRSEEEDIRRRYREPSVTTASSATGSTISAERSTLAPSERVQQDGPSIRYLAHLRHVKEEHRLERVQPMAPERTPPWRPCRSS
jgi:hypothetical protein